MEEMGSVNILRAKYTSGYTLAVKRSNTCSKKEFKALLNLGGIKFERDKISDTPEHEKYMVKLDCWLQLWLIGVIIDC